MFQKARTLLLKYAIVRVIFIKDIVSYGRSCNRHCSNKWRVFNEGFFGLVCSVWIWTSMSSCWRTVFLKLFDHHALYCRWHLCLRFLCNNLLAELKTDIIFLVAVCEIHRIIFSWPSDLHVIHFIIWVFKRVAKVFESIVVPNCNALELFNVRRKVFWSACQFIWVDDVNYCRMEHLGLFLDASETTHEIVVSVAFQAVSAQILLLTFLKDCALLDSSTARIHGDLAPIELLHHRRIEHGIVTLTAGEVCSLFKLCFSPIAVRFTFS